MGFDFVDGMLEHCALYSHDVAVESEGAADDAGEVDNYPVITGSSVVGEFKVTKSEEATILVLEYFYADRIKGGTSGSSTKIAVVQCLRVFSSMSSLTVLRTDEEIIIVLIEMDDSETVDQGVARLFFNHGVDDLFPPGEAVSISDAILDEGVVTRPNGVSGGFDDSGFKGILFEAVGF